MGIHGLDRCEASECYNRLMGIPKDFQALSDQELEGQATDLRNNGQITDAIAEYKELVKRFEAQGNAKRAANMQHMIGVSYKIANKTEASLAALANAKQRYEQANDGVGVGRVLRDEGITYQYVHDFDHALPLLEESVDVLGGTDDFAELGISHSKLGNLYMEQGNLAEAETWLVSGLEILENKADHWFYTATTHLHIAELHLKRHEDDEALEEINRAEKAFLNHGGDASNARRLAQIEALKTITFLELGDRDQARQHKDHCEELLGKLDDASAKYLKEKPEFKKILEYKF